MKPIHVCITVFNRYDLLKRLIESINHSTVQPDRIYIIDRGHDSYQLAEAIGSTRVTIVDLPGQSLPAAWNWFIQNVPEERIITSDDIEFFPEALRTFRDTPGYLVGLNDGKSSHFACFMIRDACVEAVGLFDESLSPNYMYFEDTDYNYRMKLLGIPVGDITCMVHGLCQSWEKKTEKQREEHHPKFIQAEQNYIRKWGGKPGEEIFTVPYGVHNESTVA